MQVAAIFVDCKDDYNLSNDRPTGFWHTGEMAMIVVRPNCCRAVPSPRAWPRAWAAVAVTAMTMLMSAYSSNVALAAAPDKVTIALTPTLAFAPVYIAIDKGYFRDENIEPIIESTPLATDSVSMTANGQSDVGATATGVSLFNAGYRGLDFKIVASMAVHPAPTTLTPLLIRKDLWDSGKVRSIKDLKGRPISTNAPGASIEYKLTLMLHKNGMQLTDVRPIAIGLPETLVALQNKAVDAAILGEPYATEAEIRGLAVLDAPDSAVAVGDLGTALVFNGNFIKQRRDVAIRTLRALMRASRDLQLNNWNTPENVAILTKRFKVAPGTMEKIVFPFFEPTLQIAKYLPSLQHQAEIHVENKRLLPAAAKSIGPLIDESLVDEAAAKH